MVALPANLLAKMASAPASATRLPYINHGKYELLCEKFIIIQSQRNGTSIVAEFYVLASEPNPDGLMSEPDKPGGPAKPFNTAGSRCAMVCKVTGEGTKGDMATQNLKSFIVGLMGEEEFNTQMANPELGVGADEDETRNLRYGAILEWLQTNIKGFRIDDETVLSNVQTGSRAGHIDARNRWYHVEITPELKEAYAKFLDGKGPLPQVEQTAPATE